jgi:hypothetical protein
MATEGVMSPALFAMVDAVLVARVDSEWRRATSEKALARALMDVAWWRSCWPM